MELRPSGDWTDAVVGDAGAAVRVQSSEIARKACCKKSFDNLRQPGAIRRRLTHGERRTWQRTHSINLTIPRPNQRPPRRRIHALSLSQAQSDDNLAVVVELRATLSNLVRVCIIDMVREASGAG